MTNEILTKLNKLIIHPNAFRNEQDVVYFLVEIRKFMEREDLAEQYKVVKFYADWVLHPIKERNLDYIESIIKKIEDNADNGGSSFVLMEDFQDNLSVLLNSSKVMLPDFTCEEPKWIHFMFNLSRVLNDQPVLLNSRHNSKVESLTFSKGDRTRLIHVDIKIGGRDLPLHFVSGRYIRLMGQAETTADH